jgi:hypothetical protein
VDFGFLSELWLLEDSTLVAFFFGALIGRVSPKGIVPWMLSRKSALSSGLSSSSSSSDFIIHIVHSVGVLQSIAALSQRGWGQV